VLDRVGEVRRALAAEIGVVVPGVRLRDDLSREAPTYAIRVRDELAGEGTLFLEKYLAVCDRAPLADVPGIETLEPVYGLPAKWIDPRDREAALQRGALVFDAVSILGSHLAEVARSHAAGLVGRQELQTLLEHLRATVPALVKEVGTEALPLAALHKTFGLLLRERAWPRDPVCALEAIVDAAAHSRDPRELAEAARRTIVPQLLRRRGTTRLEPLIVTPEPELRLTEPALALAVRERVAAYGQEVPRDRAAVVCTGALRPVLADFLLRSGIGVEVFSYGELPPEVQLTPAAVLNEALALS
jgi:flagellar biosynthesis protein FlhA